MVLPTQTNGAADCPTGFLDSYDETVIIKEGEWRGLVGDNNGATLLQDIPLFEDHILLHRHLK